jgi:hypothetical protein
MERRMNRVRVLLETHDEVYVLSRRERGYKAEFTTRKRRHRCGHCRGGGCDNCERGRVTLIERDAYDTGHEGTFDPLALTRRERAARIDDEIQRLRERELVRAGVVADSVAFEADLKRADARDRCGSYRELRLARDRMPRHLEGEAAVRWLAEHMPRTIRVPRWAYERELEELRREVDELHRDGLAFSEIAARLGIPQRQVRRLTKARA